MPRAPPLDQRSWCHCPTMFFRFVGLTAICGSTSASRKFWPDWAGWTQPAYGLGGPEDTCTGPDASTVLAASSASPLEITEADIRRPFIVLLPKTRSRHTDARDHLLLIMARIRPVVERTDRGGQAHRSREVVAEVVA